jgi:hypothetical protein
MCQATNTMISPGVRATHTANSGRGPSGTCMPRAFPLSHCISLVLTRLGVPAEEWKKRRLPIRWDLRLRSLHFGPGKVSKTVTRSCMLGAWLNTFCKTPLAASIDSSTRQGPTAPAEAPWAESRQRHEVALSHSEYRRAIIEIGINSASEFVASAATTSIIYGWPGITEKGSWARTRTKPPQ